MKNSYYTKTKDEFISIIEQGGYRKAKIWEDDKLLESENEYVNEHGDMVKIVHNLCWMAPHELVAKIIPHETIASRTWKGGYVLIGMCGKLRLLHRIVASTFLEKPDGKDFCNHKDGNKENNSVNNLEWCTHQENMQHYRKFIWNKQ